MGPTFVPLLLTTAVEPSDGILHPNRYSKVWSAVKYCDRYPLICHEPDYFQQQQETKHEHESRIVSQNGSTTGENDNNNSHASSAEDPPRITYTV